MFDIDARLYYIFPIFVIMTDLFVHWTMREYIWSIAECEVDKNVRESETFKGQKNFSMSYLSEYIVEFKKDYALFMKLKKIVPIIKSIWWIVYLLLPLWFNFDKLVIPHNMTFIQLAANAVFVLSISDGNRNTKYDRIRLEREDKQKGIVACYDQADIQKNKVLAALAYLGILIFIPAIVARNSKFARFHINQGLSLFFFEFALVAAKMNFNIPVIVWCIVGIIILAYVIVGTINACKGQCKKLPLIGNKTYIE